MENQGNSKKDWQTPEIIDLDITDETKGGKYQIATEPNESAGLS